LSALGMGPVTTLAFAATGDEVTRFKSAHQFESYLGLVPREWSAVGATAEGATYHARQQTDASFLSGGSEA
jgi:transposase